MFRNFRARLSKTADDRHRNGIKSGSNLAQFGAGGGGAMMLLSM